MHSREGKKVRRPPDESLELLPPFQPHQASREPLRNDQPVQRWGKEDSLIVFNNLQLELLQIDAGGGQHLGRILLSVPIHLLFALSCSFYLREIGQLYL